MRKLFVMTKGWFVYPACLCAAVLLMLPCIVVGADPQRRLKIGVVSGLSGIASKWNHYQNLGLQLAQEDLARSGTKIDLVFEDSQTVGSKAITAFNKLIDFDHVDAVIADDFGYVVAPLIPLADQKKKLLVALSLPQDQYCRLSKSYFFSITSQFVYSEAAFEKFFRLRPEVKRIALFIFDDPEWGQTYYKIWTAIAARRGVKVVYDYRSTETTPDFNVVLAKALAQKPDALVLAHEPIVFSKAVQTLGYRGPILSANNFLEVIAAGVHPGDVLDRVFVVDPEIEPEFAQKFRARFHDEPILEAYAGYEALRAVAQAFTLNYSHPEVAMHTLKYKGLAGEIDFTRASCAGNITRWGLFKFQDRRLTAVAD
jgi:ABC-type branched-subunit amino acid transport system substrate-binding protein